MDLILLEQKMKEREYSNIYICQYLDYAKKLQENKVPIIFDSKHLALLIGVEEKVLYQYSFSRDKCYTDYKISKKNGGTRDLSIPSPNMKYFQRWILDNILYKLSTHEAATGFVPGKSILKNAEPHVGKDVVLNMDISNFFPSIYFWRVKELFLNLGYNEKLAILLANLCTYEGCLPQGAPSSPYISNLIFKVIDLQINSLINDKVSYTRYADDITLSGDQKVVELGELVKTVIEQNGFEINTEKFRVSYRHQQQVVTGLVVNRRVRVKEWYHKLLRQQIYFIEKNGIEEHLNYSTRKNGLKSYLFGIANYIKMVEHQKGEEYLRKLNKIQWLE